MRVSESLTRQKHERPRRVVPTPGESRARQRPPSPYSESAYRLDWQPERGDVTMDVTQLTLPTLAVGRDASHAVADTRS